MNRSVLFTAGLVFLLLEPHVSPAADPPRTDSRPTFWVIPHTHWEGAVFKTREEYLDMGLPNILKAMRLLKEQPEFRFVLDQVAYVRPFLERYPGPGGRFPQVPGRGAAATGRRARCHARREHARRRDLRPADAVRQAVLSRQAGRRRDHRLAARHLRPPCPDAATDGAGRLTSRSGSSAGCPGRTIPRSSSGRGSTARRIPAFWLPYSYGLLYHSPRDLPGVRGLHEAAIRRSLTPNSPGKRPRRPGGSGRLRAGGAPRAR